MPSNRWTAAEDQALESGVRDHGYRWKIIEESYKDILVNRIGGSKLRDRVHNIRLQRIKTDQPLGAFEQPIPGKNIVTNPRTSIVPSDTSVHHDSGDVCSLTDRLTGLDITPSSTSPSPTPKVIQQSTDISAEDTVSIEAWVSIACRPLNVYATPLKPNTVTSYKSHAKMMYEQGLLCKLGDSAYVLSELSSRYKDNTVRSRLGFVNAILRNMTDHEYASLIVSTDLSRSELKDTYFDLFLKYQHAYETKLHSQEKSESEEMKWVSFDDLKEFCTKLRADILIDHPLLDTHTAMYQWQRYVWFLLELKQGTLRYEYSTLKISKYDPTKDNHLTMAESGRMALVFHGHKADKAVGTQAVVLNETVCPDLSILYNFRLSQGQEYLFVSSRLTIFSEQAFSTYVGDITHQYLGKRIGCQMLRKIAASEYYKDDKTLGDKAAYARSMLHSTHMSERYRRL